MAREVASIAIRIAFQVILVLRLGFPEVAGGGDLCHDAAWPQARGVDIADRPERLLALLLGDIENLRTIRHAEIVALAIESGRIVDLEEELQKIAIADVVRVVVDLDGLGMSSVVAIGRVRHIAAGISDACVDDAGQLADQVLHAPEATTGEDGPFKLACHTNSSVSRH